MKRFSWFLILLFSSKSVLAETPKPLLHPEAVFPDAPLSARLSEAVPLARYTVEVFAIRDPAKGWGAAGRMDYRMNRRWSLSIEQSRKITEGGFTIRLGAVK